MTNVKKGAGRRLTLIFSFVSAVLGVVSLVFSVLLFAKAQNVSETYQSSAKYFLSPRNEAMDTAEMNNNLVVGSKYVDTIGSYLMTEETMKLLLEDVVRYGEIDPENFKLDYKYSASGLLSLFTFVTPEKEDTNLVFQVKCKAYSPNDSRVLLDVFGRIVDERCQAAVLKGAYEVRTIAAPKDGEIISSNGKQLVRAGINSAYIALNFLLTTGALLVLPFRMPKKELCEDENNLLNITARGEGGFGSTGKL